MFQYRSTSIFSGLPESIKLVIMLSLVFGSVLFGSLKVLSILFAICFFLLLISGYKDFLKLYSMLLPVLFVYLIFFVLFFSNYQGSIWDKFFELVLRIFCIFSAFAWFTFTTDILKVMKLMQRLHLPKTLTLSFYIMLRFLPEIEHQYREIVEVQKARGLTIRRPFEYIRGHFVPLIMVLIERVEELEIAFYLKRNIH